MVAIKWWLSFAGYALCWIVGAGLAYALFPFHALMRELGNLADWGVKNMKRMVAYLPILALFVLFPALVCASDGKSIDGYDLIAFFVLYLVGFVMFFLEMILDMKIIFRRGACEFMKISLFMAMLFVCIFIGAIPAFAGYGSVFIGNENESIPVRVIKKILFGLAAFLFVFYLFERPSLAGQETRYYDRSGRYYDRSGRYQGRATTNTANPSQQSLYDNRGHYLGRAMTKPDGSVKVYDAGGRFMGSSLQSRPAQPKK